VFQSLVEGFHGGLVFFLLGEDVESTVNDVFGNSLLTFVHDVVHELGNDQITKLGIRQNFTLLGAVTTGHESILLNLVVRRNASGLLRTLRTVVRTALLTILDALGIQHTAQDVVTDTRKVLHAAAADKHNRVLLQVVAFTRDVANGFNAVLGQANLGNLTKSR